MRTNEMIQKDLDAVAREFPNSRGSMLPVGKITLETGFHPSPLPIRRYDFLASKGELSKEEAKMLSHVFSTR